MDYSFIWTIIIAAIFISIPIAIIILLLRRLKKFSILTEPEKFGQEKKEEKQSIISESEKGKESGRNWKRFCEGLWFAFLLIAIIPVFVGLGIPLITFGFFNNYLYTLYDISSIFPIAFIIFIFFSPVIGLFGMIIMMILCGQLRSSLRWLVTIEVYVFACLSIFLSLYLTVMT